MPPLVAEARARTRTPESLIRQFRHHMAEHGLAVDGPVERSRIAFPGVTALLDLAADGVALRIEATTADWLADAKVVVAGHLDSFRPDEALGIVWTGDGPAAEARPHNFRAARVTAAAFVTPRMRRLRVEGRDLLRFASDEQMHVKLIIPEPGTAPAWPVVSASGQPVLAPGTHRRTYTVRRAAPDGSWLDIDLVAHGDEGPGSAFALRARPGDPIGLMGPGGGGIAADGWTLLAGDETALPVIARSLEAMPRDARGLALIEVADVAEEQAIGHPPGLELRWLHRGAAPYGAALLDAVRAVTPPADQPASGWAACGQVAARDIREHWSGLPRDRFRAAAYWRQDGER